MKLRKTSTYSKTSFIDVKEINLALSVSKKKNPRINFRDLNQYRD